MTADPTDAEVEALAARWNDAADDAEREGWSNAQAMTARTAFILRALVAARRSADARVAAAVMEEREACAAGIERIADEGADCGSWDDGITPWEAAQICAAHIRERPAPTGSDPLANLLAEAREAGRMEMRDVGGQGMQLPERDTSRPAERQGLFQKFRVERTDGSHMPGGRHYGCRYYVLDVDHDPFAQVALAAYADACEATHPQLADDLRNKWAAIRALPVKIPTPEPPRDDH